MFNGQLHEAERSSGAPSTGTSMQLAEVPHGRSKQLAARAEKRGQLVAEPFEWKKRRGGASWL